MIFLLTAKQAYNLKVHKIKYFKLAWTYLDLSLIAFSFTSFAIWLYRVWEAQSIMDKISANLKSSSGGKLISLQMLAYWDNVLICMLAFCACIGSLKFFKLLQYNRTIHRLSMAFQYGLGKIAVSLFFISILIFAWLQLGFVKFSSSIYQFSTFVKTMETGICMMLGKLPLTDMMQVNPLWTMVIHVTFNFFVVWIMFRMVIILLGEALITARKDEKEPLHLDDYIYEKIKSFIMSMLAYTSRKRHEIALEKEMRASVLKHADYAKEMDSFEAKINGILAHSTLLFENAQYDKKTSRYNCKYNNLIIYITV
jgi:hypothetical protein